MREQPTIVPQGYTGRHAEAREKQLPSIGSTFTSTQSPATSHATAVARMRARTSCTGGFGRTAKAQKQIASPREAPCRVPLILTDAWLKPLRRLKHGCPRQKGHAISREYMYPRMYLWTYLWMYLWMYLCMYL